MRWAFSKGMVIGSAVAIAVLPTATVLAGSGVGAVFNLGQSNSVNATSTLTGATAGKQLQVTNTSTGTGATGVGINVAAGKPPLAVNSSTQVANLNATYLRGKGPGAFLSSAPGSVGPAQLSGTFLKRIFINDTYGGGSFQTLGSVNVVDFCHYQLSPPADNTLDIGFSLMGDSGEFNLNWINTNTTSAHDDGSGGTSVRFQNVGSATGTFVVHDGNTGEIVTGTLTTFDNGSGCTVEGNMYRTTTAN